MKLRRQARESGAGIPNELIDHMLIMPEQWGPGRPDSGERKLFRALLREAMITMRHNEAESVEGWRAREWVASDERDADGWFSFVDVAEHLGFTPSRLRAQILANDEDYWTKKRAREATRVEGEGRQPVSSGEGGPTAAPMAVLHGCRGAS